MPDRVVLNGPALAELIESPAGPVGREVLRRTIRVETAAKRACPVDTGRLRSSITHEVAVDVRGLAGRVGTNVEYAPYVEFGTSRASAQPFLIPALGAAQ
jgi:HK97 gp10 family phage protein